MKFNQVKINDYKRLALGDKNCMLNFPSKRLTLAKDCLSAFEIPAPIEGSIESEGKHYTPFANVFFGSEKDKAGIKISPTQTPTEESIKLQPGFVNDSLKRLNITVRSLFTFIENTTGRDLSSVRLATNATIKDGSVIVTFDLPPATSESTAQ